MTRLIRGKVATDAAVAASAAASVAVAADGVDEGEADGASSAAMKGDAVRMRRLYDYRFFAPSHEKRSWERLFETRKGGETDSISLSICSLTFFFHSSSFCYEKSLAFFF